MRVSYYKNVTVLAVAISLFALMLSACGTKNQTNDNFPTKNTNQSSSEKGDIVAVKKAGSKDPFGKYDPAIDISFIRYVDYDLTDNVLPRTPGETIEDNRWLRLYKNQLGISVKYDWIVKGIDAYSHKINVVLASGNLPDVVNVDSSQLKQLTDAGMIEDMTQYFNDYAAPLTKDIYTQEDTAVLNSATFDGKLMAVPNTDSSIECAQFLWIRADWLKKLGFEPPKTMDELLKISEAFATKDPDGNGKEDTYGLAITKDLYAPCMGLEGFFAGYDSYPNFWLKDSSGKLIYGSVQSETKAALQKLAEMYKAGQLDKEFGIKDGGKVAESIAEGKIGIQFGEQWNPMYPLISSYNNDNNADWTGYTLVSAGSKPLRVPLKFRTFRYLAVKKGYAHPEALVKMANLYLEKNWGKTNEFDKYYMPKENGSVGVWKFSPINPYPPFKNLNAFQEIEQARKSNTVSMLKGEPKVIESNIDAYIRGDKSLWGWEKIYGVNGVFNVLNKYKADNSLMFEKFTGAPTKTMVEKKEALYKYEKEEFTKIIMGAAPIDEFDKFVVNWHKLGGADITKEVNDWYNCVNK